MNSLRRKTRPVKVGFSVIGGGRPVTVQTMWKSPLTGDLEKVSAGIQQLAEIGCEILRFAVPDMDSAAILGQIAERSPIPLVADIHFDYKLALACLDSKIAKIRINPGNVGAVWKVKEVLRKASDRGIPIRVGINSGSLPRKLRGETDRGGAMLMAAEDEINLLEQVGFTAAVFSLKSSDLEEMVQANERFSKHYDYPLHIGMTEAGPLVQGIVRNSIGISRLLRKGIGDTIRVSLSDSPANAIITGKAILSAENQLEGGVKIVSCPTCGRKTFDVSGFLKSIEEDLRKMQKNITVAVMGCEVNGPGEAKHADLGITGAGNSVLLFKKGTIIARTGMEEGKKLFLKELHSL